MKKILITFGVLIAITIILNPTLASAQMMGRYYNHLMRSSLYGNLIERKYGSSMMSRNYSVNYYQLNNQNSMMGNYSNSMMGGYYQ